MKMDVSHHSYTVVCINMDDTIAANGLDVEVGEMINANRSVRGEVDVIKRSVKVIDHVVSVLRGENERVRSFDHVSGPSRPHHPTCCRWHGHLPGHHCPPWNFLASDTRPR